MGLFLLLCSINWLVVQEVFCEFFVHKFGIFNKKLYLCSAKVVPTNIGMIIWVDLEILTINC